MFRHLLGSILSTIPLLLLSITIEAAPNQPNDSSQPVYQAQTKNNRYQGNPHATAAERDAVMIRDQVDDTDIFEIQLGSSEIEDEEQINRLEQKQVFSIPPK